MMLSGECMWLQNEIIKVNVCSLWPSFFIRLSYTVSYSIKSSWNRSLIRWNQITDYICFGKNDSAVCSMLHAPSVMVFKKEKRICISLPVGSGVPNHTCALSNASSDLFAKSSAINAYIYWIQTEHFAIQLYTSTDVSCARCLFSTENGFRSFNRFSCDSSFQ